LAILQHNWELIIFSFSSLLLIDENKACAASSGVESIWGQVKTLHLLNNVLSIFFVPSEYGLQVKNK